MAKTRTLRVKKNGATLHLQRGTKESNSVTVVKPGELVHNVTDAEHAHWMDFLGEHLEDAGLTPALDPKLAQQAEAKQLAWVEKLKGMKKEPMVALAKERGMQDVDNAKQADVIAFLSATPPVEA